jgi:DMSO/TMAO reductase YedYZ molybdopterin-dependent catalytic subunit
MSRKTHTDPASEPFSVDPHEATPAAGATQSRRAFLRQGGLAALALSLGAGGDAARAAAAHATPAAAATHFGAIPGKEELVVLNDRPINAETPAHLLDDDRTPARRLFVRNNGIPPDSPGPDGDAWVLEVTGESCLNPRSFTVGELKSRFPRRSLALTIECGGNGRAEFYPPARGNQWTTGAVGCPEWTGVRLRDVLEECGLAPDAVYLAYEGADRHLSGDPSKRPISRGVPVTKALEDESLLAWGMNGAELPELHGYPLRLVFGGWPASVSGKWLQRLLLRDRVHDGPKMGGQSYRVPCRPVAPGAAVADEDMCIIESMPVKSLITHPRSGHVVADGRVAAVRGHAWAGDLEVAAVHTSIDYGASWRQAELDAPANRFAWQRWSARIGFPGPGYYEIWARATDSEGKAQPMVLPAWNPRGYLNNACHRIAVEVAA